MTSWSLDDPLYLLSHSCPHKHVVRHCCCWCYKMLQGWLRGRRLEGGVMASSTHKVCRFTVHTRTQGQRFQIFKPETRFQRSNHTRRGVSERRTRRAVCMVNSGHAHDQGMRRPGGRAVQSECILVRSSVIHGEALEKMRGHMKQAPLMPL